MSEAITLEHALSPARQSELGIHGWPTWKDGEGDRWVSLDAGEKSFFLAGRATLTPEGGTPVEVQAGDLVLVPAGRCRWQVHELVRRHYRTEALTPACCII